MPKKNQKVTGGGKKRFLVILLIMFVAIGACAVAAYLWYEMENIKSQMAETGKPAGKVADVNQAPTAPLYVPLETFTVSLKPTADEDDRVLYIGLTLRVKDEQSKSLIEQFLPEMRSRLLILFSQQSGDNLSTDEGKNHLIEKIKSAVSEPLSDNQRAMITDVLFNDFILR